MSESQILIDPTAMKEILPLLPLKGTVIFPHQVQGLGVGRPKSLRALEAALAGEPRLIVLAAQKEDDLDNPGPDDIYRTGSVCRILQVGKQPDGVLQVIVEGVVRAEILVAVPHPEGGRMRPRFPCAAALTATISQEPHEYRNNHPIALTATRI